MKKYLLIPILAVLLLVSMLSLANKWTANEEEQAMNEVIRLHVRAADNSEEEQTLKLQVRDRVLQYTQTVLQECFRKQEAQRLLEEHLTEIQTVAEEAVRAEGKNHTVSVSLRREPFEYREYDGFFLPEGIYDALIVSIGPGEGQNWWCVVFPAACYLGSAETIETDETRMPECFRVAKSRTKTVTVEFWLWNKLKEWFS